MSWKTISAIMVASVLTWLTIISPHTKSDLDIKIVSKTGNMNYSHVHDLVADKITKCATISPSAKYASRCIAEVDAPSRVGAEVVNPTISLNKDNSSIEFKKRLDAFRAKWDAQRAPNDAAPWLYASIDCLRTGEGEPENCSEIINAALDIEKKVLSEANSGNTDAQLTLGMHYLDRSYSNNVMLVDQQRLLAEAVRNLQSARDAGSETASTLLSQINM